MQEELLQRIDLEIEKSRSALVRDTIKLVRINSEKSASQPGAPFGPGAKEVLDLGGSSHYPAKQISGITAAYLS